MLVGISLLGEVNRVVTWLITGGVVVLRLLVSGLRIQRRIGVSHSAYNDSYPKPDGRSGTHVSIIYLVIRASGIPSGLHLSFSSSVFAFVPQSTAIFVSYLKPSAS